MSLRRNCPCDLDGICPYEDMHSGYIGSCEYWCGAEEPEDDPEVWEDDDDDFWYEPDIKPYTSANPWDAPGMKLSDFL